MGTLCSDKADLFTGTTASPVHLVAHEYVCGHYGCRGQKLIEVQNSFSMEKEQITSIGVGILCFSGTQHAPLVPLTAGSMTSLGGRESVKATDSFPTAVLPGHLRLASSRVPALLDFFLQEAGNHIIIVFC